MQTNQSVPTARVVGFTQKKTELASVELADTEKLLSFLNTNPKEGSESGKLMMMKMNKVVTSIIFVVILINLTSAATTVPKIEPYVNDFAHLLTPDEITKLNLQCDIIEKNTSYEIAIVTVQDTGGQDKILYANEIGDQNGVGKKGKDNGVVVLWSVANGGAIATGRYSESILNDAKVARIGREARPLFDQGKYYDGFSQIVTAINKEIVSSQDGSVNATNSTSTGQSGNLDGGHIFMLIMIVVVALWILSKLDIFDIFTGVAVGSILSGNSSRGGSKGGGGGGSFGGGSFGGGGGGF